MYHKKQKEICFARQHLEMNEVAFHDYMLAVSKNSGIFYRDDRRDAAEFKTSKSRIYRIVQSIRGKGFMVSLVPSKRLPNGTLTSGQYKPLTHDEWAEKHPGVCRLACPTGGTGSGPKIDADLSQNGSRDVGCLEPARPIRLR